MNLSRGRTEPQVAALEDHLRAVQGRRVLLRADINVPLTQEDSMLCDYRLRRVAGVVRRLLRMRCSVVVMSHLGQPGGKVDESLSLRPFVEPFAQRVGYPVQFAASCIGPEPKELLKSPYPNQVILLENLRFHAGEEQASWDFAAEVAKLGDIYVNDAFAVSHRPHASVILMPHLLPAYAGPAFLDEYRRATQLLQQIRHPVVGISGGRKLDKLAAYQRLLPLFDRLLLGSGFAMEQRSVSLLGDHFDRVIFPVDAVVKRSDGTLRTAKINEVEPGEAAIDLGPETVQYYCAVAREAGTILFNGSLGLLPADHPLSPTREIMSAVVRSSAIKVVCGGTGCALFLREGYGQQIDYLFPGGGATLTFLDGQSNPALAALQEASQTARQAAVTLMDPASPGQAPSREKEGTP
jgi:phosphoglycerate kinase